jgi:putative chitinase
MDPAALRHVCPNLTTDAAQALSRDLATALVRFEPNIGRWATAYFIGQCAHESGEFRWSREIWGPTPAQKQYWKRRDLQGPGPLWPGLGFLTRGGGWIQTTGRINYQAATRRLGRRSWMRLALNAGRSDNASLLAAVWWADHFPADMSGRDWNVERVTRIVNGGVNGLEERRRYTRKAIQARDDLRPRKLG